METRKPKYNSLSEWKKAEPNAYAASYYNGLLPKICDLFGWKQFMIKKVINLTLNDCKVEALKYKTKTEWRYGHGLSYGKAYRKGWLEECCKHMMVIRTSPTFNSIEYCQKDALKYKTRSDWAKAKGSLYQFANKQGWLEECCIPSRYKTNKYWTLEKCKEDALNYKTKTEWLNKSLSSYRVASKNKWIEECCKHMVFSRIQSSLYNLEQCQKDALKYKKRSDWQKAKGSLHYVAIKNGWMKECFPPRCKPKRYWTLEKCKEEALKYTTRTEWATLSNSSYSVAQKNKWINECCLHMKKPLER